MNEQIGTQWVAKWSKGRADAMVWTVRGVTVHGIYITSPTSRTLGHLLNERDFLAQYERVEQSVPACG